MVDTSLRQVREGQGTATHPRTVNVTTRVAEILGEPEQLPVRLHGGLGDFTVDLTKTALLCVDMQESLARSREGPKAESAAELGLGDALEYYWTHIAEATRNLQRLQAAFRHADLEVVHVRADSLTRDGRDQSRMKARCRAGLWVAGKRLSSSVPEGNPIIHELAPKGDELVITKNGAGAFSITRLDLALHAVGIECLVVGGAITNQCVEATVRGAFDHGFGVVLVDDACATYSDELRRGTLRSVGDWFCKVAFTDQVLSWLEDA